MSRSDAHRLADMLRPPKKSTTSPLEDAPRSTPTSPSAARSNDAWSIGEAAKAVSDDLRAQQPEIPWTAMAKIRDRLSHHYHRIDPDQLWTVATTDIPALVNQLRGMQAI